MFERIRLILCIASLNVLFVASLGVAFADSETPETVSGTAFFVTHDGYLVTNAHVVAGRDAIYVRTGVGDLLPVTLIRIDQRNDLALLKVDGRHFSALPIAASESVRRGTRVVTVGFPNVDVQGFEPKLTEGIVSSLTGLRDEPRTFQISVPIQPGNSGGPLVTEEGNVVGVVVSKLDALKMLLSQGDIPQGVNYAVKSNYLRELLGTVGALKEKLLRPNTKKQADLSDLNQAIESATVLIIARQHERPPVAQSSPPAQGPLPLNPELASPPQARTNPPAAPSVTPRVAQVPADGVTLRGQIYVALATNVGRIVLELNADAAPQTVANFVQYVKTDQYGGTQFHRVIAGFMVQGGGFTQDFKQKVTKPPIVIEAERSSKAGLRNARGAVAMARTKDPNSATAQFFINLADNKFLDFREPTEQGYGYTVFGTVVAGMDVVDKIGTIRTASGGPFGKDVPIEPVVIISATVIDKP